MTNNIIKNIKQSVDKYINCRIIDREKDHLLWSIITNDLQETWELAYFSKTRGLIKDDRDEIISAINYCMRKIPPVARGSIAKVIDWTTDRRTTGQMEREAMWGPM